MKNIEKHVTIVASLQVGLGILGLLLGCFIFFLLTGIGAAVDDDHAFVVLSSVGTSVGLIFLIFSVPSIIGGIGLFRRRGWARILILILSAIDLLNVPLGTALGIYSIIVLVDDDAIRLFRDPAPAELPPPPAVA